MFDEYRAEIKRDMANRELEVKKAQREADEFAAAVDPLYALFQHFGSDKLEVFKAHGSLIFRSRRAGRLHHHLSLRRNGEEFDVITYEDSATPKFKAMHRGLDLTETLSLVGSLTSELNV